MFNYYAWPLRSSKLQHLIKLLMNYVMKDDNSQVKESWMRYCML